VKQVKRLFNQFRPVSYQLKLEPSKQTMKATGRVEILGFKVGRPSQRITLHSKNLDIKSISLFQLDKRDNSHKVNVTRHLYHRSYDELRIHSDETIYPGKYKLVIDYQFKISRQMSGLYPSFYDHNDVKEIILATQFESHHAREVFPCIDEPQAKAIFNLRLVADKDEVVLANCGIASQKPAGKDSNQVVYTFKPTPIMSSYLLAFVIGKLDCVKGVTNNGVKVAVYSRPNQCQFTDFALTTAIKTLEFFNDYFAIDYPLDKCDLVALPDFASGAMENWGLITFREQALLVDEKNISTSMKQYVANVIAHELTHQWFGNLVTMEWWNDLWLNESFASLMSYVAVNDQFPEWDVWTQFINDEQVPALRLDSLKSTHPVSVDISHPDEIRTIFDNISYEKGASVLFMLLKYIGEDKFQSGLRHYLTNFSYKNTKSVDLWNSLSEVSKIDVSSFMDPWIKQPGYPILNVAHSSKDKINLTQQRFYLDPTIARDDAVWPIPLFTEATNKDMVKDKVTTLLTTNNFQYLINVGQLGFYRTIYENELNDQLINRINDYSLSDIDRLSILANSFEAAKGGYTSTTQSLNLLAHYQDETNLLVWECIASNISSLRLVMDNEELREKMKPFIVNLAIKQYHRLGWRASKSDTYFDIMLRPIIVSLMAMADHQDAIDKIQSLFAHKDEKSIDPNLRSVVYSKMAQLGNVDVFNELLKMYDNSDNSEEKITIAAAITNFKQPELIDRALALIKSDHVRLQDVAYWISYSLSNRHAKDKSWQWIKDNWQWLEENLGDDLSFYMLPRYVARVYSNAAFINEFKDFFHSHMSDGFIRPLAQAIETINWQSEWKKRDLDSIKTFFI